MSSRKNIRGRFFNQNTFYHSGFQVETAQVPAAIERKRVQAEDETSSTRIVFSTRKYPSPLNIGITTSVDWDDTMPMTWDDRGFWYIELTGQPFEESFQFKIRLDNIWMAGGDMSVPADINDFQINDDQVYLAHTIRFSSDRWRPGHLVTLRTPVDGWSRDVFGKFFSPEGRPGTWSFELDRSRFRESKMEASFLIDRQHWMKGSNIELSLGEQETDFGDADVDFDISPSAYIHAYDNLVAEETLWEQRMVPPSSRPDAQKIYDVLIVGSGIAGGTLADALSDQGLETLVIEAGGLGYPIHMNGLPRSGVLPISRDELNSFYRRDSGFVGGLIFNLGGRSNYWSGIIPEMQAWEFSNGPWPNAVKDYLLGTDTNDPSGYEAANELMKKQVSMGPYQDKVVNLLQKRLEDSYQVEILPRSMHQPNLNSLGELQNVLRRSNGAYSTSDLLLDSLGANGDAGSRYLDLALHHLTTKIEPAGEHVLAHCQDLIGNRRCSYKGRHVVLCCGSVETPRLAIQSGLTDPNNKMGRGLTDHAAYSYKHNPKLPTTGPLSWLGNVDGHAKLMIRAVSQSDQPFNMEVLINGDYWDSRHADQDLWDRVEPDDARVGIKFIFDSPLVDENYIQPQGEGRKPLIHVKPNLHAVPHFDAMVKARNAIFTALGIPAAELSTEWDDDEWWVGNHGSVQHSGGSMRMSDQGTGVVDQNLTMLDYDNIHCCDASVFPSIPAANPTLTVGALALRLAEHLNQLCQGTSERTT